MHSQTSLLPARGRPKSIEWNFLEPGFQLYRSVVSRNDAAIQVFTIFLWSIYLHISVLFKFELNFRIFPIRKYIKKGEVRNTFKGTIVCHNLQWEVTSNFNANELIVPIHNTYRIPRI